MLIFKKKVPEKPKPFYLRQPVATVAVILTMIGMFVLGPVGVIYKGMTEELQQKVDNQTLQLMLKNQQTLIEQNKEEAERKREEDTKKFEELQKTQQETLRVIQDLQIRQAAPLQPSPTTNTPQPAVTKEVFEYYMSLPPEQQKAFKNLHPSYQVLPDP